MTQRVSTFLSVAAAVKAAGAVGLIVAKHPSSSLYPCPGDFPCIEVDYEVGTKIVFYIRSTRLDNRYYPPCFFVFSSFRKN